MCLCGRVRIVFFFENGANNNNNKGRSRKRGNK